MSYVTVTSWLSFSLVLIRRSQSSARARTDFLPTGVIERVERLDEEGDVKSYELSVDFVCTDFAGLDVLSDNGVDRSRESLVGIKSCCFS